MAKNKNELSPMMAHYKELKKQYADTIILYRLGDFYEMFYEDAVYASKVLDLTLTGRDCGLAERAPMCGVPYHAVDGYISKLIASGAKVAICEQLTNPKESSGMVKRDIIRVITPGTNTIEEMLDGTVNNYLLSIVRNKEKTKYGVALFDIVTGELKAKEITAGLLSEIEDYLMSCAPAEIIATEDICNESKQLNTVQTERLVKFSRYYDYFFDFDNAKSRIQKQFGVYGLEALGLSDYPLCVCAIGGLLEYVVSTQKRDLKHISRPIILKDDNEMFIDYNTQKNLELVETVSDRKKKGSLLGVIDKTKTGMGARMLRNWLIHPLQKPEDIAFRQNAVAELTKNITLKNAFAVCLANIYDLERLVTKISYLSMKPKDCLALAETLSAMPTLYKILQKLKSEYFIQLLNEYTDVSDVAIRLKKAITSENTPSLAKDIGYIANGYSEELDKYRAIKDNGGKFLKEFEAKQREITGVPSLKVGYNRVFGYYIEITNAKMPETLPAGYVRKQTLSTGERFTNAELTELEKEILGAYEHCVELEAKLYAELLDFLYEKITILKQLADIVAKCDCVYSLAEVAVKNRYVRPKINTKGVISIVDGRHPVVEDLLKSNRFIPNDTVLDASDNAMVIITGPNMAGKSTYIRQVALIVLLAHIGSFVPATKADICITDKIFTRIGASDNLVRGQSTFMVEMLETANILHNATPNSLLILDEIGRGTSTLDGLSIAWAIVEHLLLKIKAKTLFATHYHELSELEKLFHGIKNYRVLIQENKDGIVFLYKVARGGAQKSFGIEVASIAGVDKDVIKRAKDVLATLSETHELSGDLINKMSNNTEKETCVACEQISMFPEDEDFVKIKNILNGTDVNRCTPIEALTILSDLKKIISGK